MYVCICVVCVSVSHAHNKDDTWLLVLSQVHVLVIRSPLLVSVSNQALLERELWHSPTYEDTIYITYTCMEFTVYNHTNTGTYRIVAGENTGKMIIIVTTFLDHW